jgi:hypothetical protein
MQWKIRYSAVAELPKLAWLASAELDAGMLTVYHGSAVECRDEWMVEGVWDGDFERGDFHRSENFFGSGVRIEGDRIYFVASSALVDRLFHCFHQRRILVSNSLILLLAFTGARLNSNHDYMTECYSMLKGVKDYKKEFCILHPEIDTLYQVYYSNIVLENNELTYEIRGKSRKINSFEDYYKSLNEVISSIKVNYESPKRKTALSVFTTLSSGYDSTAVSCMVKDLGVKKCFTSRKSNSSIPSWIGKSFAIDDGGPTANALQLEISYLNHRRSSISEDELYFLAPSHAQPEVIFHSMATCIEKTCDAAVVFTGFHGDKVWDANIKEKYVNDQIIRGDTSGLNLSEIRLKSGFINVAVPFILARNMESIVKISRSPEMAPWRLNNSYDRPIPRRIAESAGVERHFFGMRKKAVLRYYYYPINPPLRKQFFEFLSKNYSMRPAYVYKYAKFNRAAYFIIRTFGYMGYFKRAKSSYLSPNIDYDIIRNKRNAFWKDINLHYLMFVWSVHALSERTAKILHKHIGISFAQSGSQSPARGNISLP